MKHGAGSEPRIRVLIVDDSASARAALRRLLSGDPAIEVIGAAGDPFEAAGMMRTDLPDVMLLDLALPRMDGLTFLRKIMAQHPMPVVVCSSHTQKGSENALRALESGAAEVIAKPSMATAGEREEAQIRLCDAVRAAASTRSGRAARPPVKPLSPGPKLTADVILPPMRPGTVKGVPHCPVIAIGASTGGTEALLEVLRAMPAGMPPIVIVQHMPERFTDTFARRLDGLCRLTVTEAQSGDRLEPGRVLIAPGNRHMIVRRVGGGYRVEIAEGPYVARHRPSVDVLFRSVAQTVGSGALGVLMTGMGDDGARGLLEMRQAGAATFVQDEASCIVFGMPKEALALGAADTTVPLGKIALEALTWVRGQARA
ncbi:chemotaxis response regulator protein-glutamate methylesterase [Pseudooceanicola sp. LIPI14-2-Ac024]|uniref:protein-glutamate methylesterase/protein-glutamine glutaminase n=1 Tax=Pseudooceanicola sp. LIPI14-2-Ac024 TaxID=3344875 RepID=UPI0035CF18E7